MNKILRDHLLEYEKNITALLLKPKGNRTAGSFGKTIVGKAGTLVQIQLCIAKEKILPAARQRGYRVKQKLTLPNGRSRIHLDAKITERFMT